MRRIGLLLITLFAFACSARQTDSIKAIDLKCEYLINPIAVESNNPRLSWVLEAKDGVFDQEQKAYQIIVSSSLENLNNDKGDIWDSGKIASSDNSQCKYLGRSLTSREQCYWKVRVYNNQNEVSSWSAPATWRMGIKPNDWSAKWIGEPNDIAQREYKKMLATYDPNNEDAFVHKPQPQRPSPMMRKSFSAKGKVKDATLYASALGYYEMGLNGKKIGDEVLAPEWTNYDKRVQYQAYDITNEIKEGDNVLSAMLADGWYLGMLGPTKWHKEYPRRGVYGDDRRLIAQLHITYEDGSEDVITTDDTWKLNAEGFIIQADNFLGQTIDANKIPKGWDNLGFDDSSWCGVYVDNDIQKNLEPQTNEPIRVFDTLEAKSITPRGKGCYVVDFGQNLAGWTRITLKGNKGDKVRVIHGEMLQDNGAVYTENLAAAISVDYFILSGERETFEPRFTYHGFRYIEICGVKGELNKEEVLAIAASSDPDVVGSFACSNNKLNQLYSNILWTQRDNMYSNPTDCPQRDERMGWMGDAQVFCQNSIFNMDMAAFYNKWIQDVNDEQTTRGTYPDIAPHADYPEIRFSNAPAWADAAVIIPWRLYENYGDKEILATYYENIKKYIANIKNQNPNLIWIEDRGNNYGDWLNGSTINDKSYPTGRAEMNKEFLSTAFFANSTLLTAKMAEVLGKTEEAAQYNDLHRQIVEALNKEFVEEDGRIKGHTQSSYALALNFDLLPESKREAAFKYMIECIDEYDGRISTGFISTIMMMKELTKWGRNDISYSLLESERFPSWLYSINQGATTIWERWDGYVKGRGFQGAGMNSFNHYTLGTVGEWMYRTILGINPDINNPGYKHFTLEPRPGGTLTWAKGSYKSIKGLISSSWKTDGSVMDYEAGIPAGTRATVILPASSVDDVTMNGKNLKSATVVNGSVNIEVGSGNYKFIVKNYKK